MILTTEEAMKKFCSNPITNSDRCVANSCMAWRWYTPTHDTNGIRIAPSERKGFCGLAGTPTVTE